MPPYSPCGRVVEFVRSCFRGKWRFFPQRPDVITSGFMYFAKEGTPFLNTPHPFGSAAWSKDGNIYPIYPVGQDIRLGSEWYNGVSPDELPPDNQVGTNGEISSDYYYPVVPPPEVRNGFDARCFIVEQDGIDIPVEAFLRPDVSSPCWWRVLAGLLSALTKFDAGPGSQFDLASKQLWPAPFTVTVHSLFATENRFAWVVGPDYQIILRVGTQIWSELWRQIWHGIGPPRNYGTWSTESVWFDESTRMVEFLEANGFDPTKPLTIVGHSKGAAVGWVLARRMTDWAAERDVEVLTFGSPKVGDFRMKAQGNIRRAVHVIHNQDIVPLVPVPAPINPFLGFLLSQAQLNAMNTWANFNSYTVIGDGFIVNRPASEVAWQTYAAWIREVLAARAPEPIEQHFIAGYVTALKATCCEPEFPFGPTLYDILFQGHDCTEGGVRVLGGAGNVVMQAIAGVRVGGAGLVVVSTKGGVELNGAGLVKLGTGGGVELNGAGLVVLHQGGGVELGGAGLVEIEQGGGVELGGAGSAVFSQNPTTYSVPGTYTFTPVVTGSHVIEGWGGGQGGAGSLPITHSAGSGGVSGLYAKKTLTLTAGVSITVIVGAGGAVALAGGTRHNGGDTSAASSAMVAPGGGTATSPVGDVTHAASSAGTGFPSMGATGGGGGGGGGPGPSASGTNGSNGASTAGGAGGPGATGGGAGGNGGATSGNGSDASAPGGGGGGSGGGGTQSGKGGDGQVTIRW